METTYTYERKKSGGRASNRTRRSVALAPREGRRLAQLCVCVALFTVVFLGRGVFPLQAESLRSELLQVIQQDTDFRGAFENLGRAISEGEPVVATMGNLWVDVFSSGGKTTIVAPLPPGSIPAAYQAEREFLASAPGAAELLYHRFGVEMEERTPALLPPDEAAVTPITPVTAPVNTLPAQPQPMYTGVPMPEGATMEEPVLDLGDTAAPVMAALSSPYGWREHPIEGSEKFHSGVDLAGAYGGAIGAFADGVVDYIGESPAYGQYLQIKHGNGITSFYAHCSKLCVQPGQQVSAGEKVAEVGDTGNVTGTHLHFELKQHGTFLNPLYYIETLP